MQRSILTVVFLGALSSPSIALAMDLTPGGCAGDLGSNVSFNRLVPLPITRGHGLHATIKMLDEYAAAETADDAGGRGLVVSPVTPFARLAMDRVEAYLARPDDATARGAFDDHDPLGWNRLLTNVDLPLVAPSNRPTLKEVDAMINSVRAVMMTAQAERWPAARTRRAAERILGPALDGDLRRAEVVMRAREFKFRIEIEFAGPTVGRVVPALIKAKSLLYVRSPERDATQLVAYQYRLSDSQVQTLILRDVDPRGGALRDQSHELAAFPKDSTLAIYELSTEIVMPDQARPTLPITHPRAAND